MNETLTSQVKAAGFGGRSFRVVYSGASCQDFPRCRPHHLPSTAPATILLLFHTSGFIKDYHLIPINMARGQAKSNIKNDRRLPPEPKDQGEVFGIRTSGV